MGATRTFSISYVVHVQPPAGAHVLRIWIPVPTSSFAQTISALAFSRPPLLSKEPRYGNAIASWEITAPQAALDLTMSFNCVRAEVRADLEHAAAEGEDSPEAMAPFLRPSRLGAVDASILQLADGIVGAQTTTLGRARAIYDYVIRTMTYDKSGTGWGKASTAYACQNHKGNCTDFHALFMSLCCAEKIPTAFEIGLMLPYAKGSHEEVGGYHCWASFRLPGQCWVMVDCSEAARHAELRKRNFGTLACNRVTLSSGRDIDLVPRQAGPPLNFFVDPYAEADGVPIPSSKTWTYSDL